MKSQKTRLALVSALAVASVADVAIRSSRESADAFAPLDLQGMLADNTTYTLTGAGNDGSKHRSQGQIVMDATAITAADSLRVLVGFKPTYVRFWNATDRVALEWHAGMADDSALKTAANGTQTLEVTGGNGGITVDDRGFRVKQNATLAAVLASKTLYYVAEA